jgi:solute carrier family 7 (L-type amino acid transporter), member 6
MSGLAEVTFFVLAVLGLFILRQGDKTAAPGARPQYRTWSGNPIIFAIAGSLLVARGVLSQPMQGLAILAAGLLGLSVFYFKFGPRGFQRLGVT